jgi:hypothetical protein
VILILIGDGDGQNGADCARLGVPEARVKPVDCLIRFVGRDAGGAKSRLGCSVIPVRDFSTVRS